MGEGQVMGKSKKYIVLPLVLAVLLLGLVAGCREKETATPTATPTTASSEFTQAQMKEILVDTISATKNARTFKFFMNVTMAMEATGGTEAKQINVDMTASGAHDQENKNMQMNMDINVESPEIEEGAQNMSMAIYIYEDNMYMKMDMPIIGEQWVKMPVSDKAMAAYDSDMVGEQLKMLETPGEIKFLKYETVDGSECYVFQITPDMHKIMEWVGQQQQITGAELDTEDIGNLSDVFKNISYLVWVARDNNLLKKIDASMLMEFDAAQFGEKGGDYDNMNMNMNMGMRLYDYDEPVIIELPEEAKDAIEMPGNINTAAIPGS
jgi:hypothetical protein